MPQFAGYPGKFRGFSLTPNPADFYGNRYLNDGGAPCVRVVGVEHARGVFDPYRDATQERTVRGEHDMGSDEPTQS